MSERAEQRDIFGGRAHEYELPLDAWTGKCRSCGAAMAFIRTERGKVMPLSLATVEERDGKRYCLSHFADCPDAKEWSTNK
jgi:hypothetical protein